MVVFEDEEQDEENRNKGEEAEEVVVVERDQGKRGSGSAGEVHLLDSAVGDEDIEHVLEGGEGRHELLDHLGDVLVDGVIVDGREVEGNVRLLQPPQVELLRDVVGDITLKVELALLRQAVDLVDEDLEENPPVHHVRALDGRDQPGQRWAKLVLRVEDEE